MKHLHFKSLSQNFLPLAGEGVFRIGTKKLFVLNALGILLLFPFMGDSISRPAALIPPAPKLDPTPAPIDPNDWKSFAKSLRQRSHRFSGSVGYVVKDLRTGHTVEDNATKIFPSASLIKLPIMVAAFQAVEEGKLSLDTSVPLRLQDKRGGSGVLKFARPGSIFTVRELLEVMIIQSDNTAAELMIQKLGFDYLQKAFGQLGLRYTEIHPDGFRLTPRHILEDNKTSPQDMAFLLERIYQKQLVSAKASEQMLTILKHQKLRDRLPRFLPTGWEIAHKTGLLRRACHDVGIVFSPGGDYLICVLTSHDPTYKMAKRFIASLGRITYDYYRGGFHHPIVQTRRSTRESPRSS